MESQGATHYAFVDTLRAIAILMVIMVHSSQHFGPTGVTPIDILAAHGMYGVQLFFIASAFTLFLSYDLRRKREPHYITNFFIRRFFRIAPLYYIGLVYYSLTSHENYSVWETVANLLFINDIHPEWINHMVPGGWSIAVEMTFYLFLPILFVRLGNIGKAFNALTISLLTNAILHFVFTQFPIETTPHYAYSMFLYYWIPNQLPVFIIGIILYFVVVKGESIRQITPPRPALVDRSSLSSHRY